MKYSRNRINNAGAIIASDQSDINGVINIANSTVIIKIIIIFAVIIV